MREPRPADDPRSEARFTLPRPECPDPGLWRSEDVGGVEDEVRSLLVAIVEAVKPRLCVETGSWRGETAVALAGALRANGRGKLWSIEVDPEAARVARDRIAQAELEAWAEIVEGSSLSWTPPGRGPIDLAFLDSAPEARAREFLGLLPRMHRRTLVVVHDTGTHKRSPRRQFGILARLGLVSVTWWPTPRGLALAQPRFLVGWRVRVAVALAILRNLVPVAHGIEPAALRLRHAIRRRPRAPRV